MPSAQISQRSGLVVGTCCLRQCELDIAIGVRGAALFQRQLGPKHVEGAPELQIREVGGELVDALQCCPSLGEAPLTQVEGRSTHDGVRFATGAAPNSVSDLVKEPARLLPAPQQDQGVDAVERRVLEPDTHQLLALGQAFQRHGGGFLQTAGLEEDVDQVVVRASSDCRRCRSPRQSLRPPG